MNIKNKSIGNIGNHYGNLIVKKEGEKYYWGIPDYSGTDYEEIPESLYNALNEFEDERLKKAI